MKYLVDGYLRHSLLLGNVFTGAVSRPGPWLRLQVVSDFLTAMGASTGDVIGPDGEGAPASVTVGGTGLSAVRGGGARLIFETEVIPFTL